MDLTSIFLFFFQTWAFGTVCFKMLLRWVILSMSGMTALPLNAASDIFSGRKCKNESTLTNSVLISNHVVFDFVEVGFLKPICQYTLYHFRS